MGRSLVAHLRTVCVLALALSAPRLAAADPPSGSYTIEPPAEAGILVPAEAQAPDCDTVEGITICLSGQPTTDGSGVIGGDAQLDFSGDVEGTLTGTFGGTVSGAAGDPRVGLTMQLSGELYSWWENEFFDVTVTQRSRCVRNEIVGGFYCLGPLRTCAYSSGSRVGCGSVTAGFAVDEQSSAWQLGLELSTDERGAVTGTATVELETGLSLAYTVTGKYDARRGSSSLRLAGLGDAAKSKLRLSSAVLAGGTATAGTLDYQISGQKGRTTLPALP